MPLPLAPQIFAIVTLLTAARAVQNGTEGNSLNMVVRPSRITQRHDAAVDTATAATPGPGNPRRRPIAGLTPQRGLLRHGTPMPMAMMAVMPQLPPVTPQRSSSISPSFSWHCSLLASFMSSFGHGITELALLPIRGSLSRQVVFQHRDYARRSTPSLPHSLQIIQQC